MSEKIKVLHVGIDSHLGGIETYLKKITTYIDKDKFEFSFLTYNGTVPCFYEELRQMGGKFYFIESRRSNLKKNKTDLEKLFTENKFDIVHCHLNSLSYITPVIIALKHNCKVIVHSRNAGCLKSLKSRLLHKVNYYKIRKMNIVRAAVSDLAGEWMFGNKDFVVLNNGLDTNKYKYSEENRKQIRKELGIDENKEVILHVGAFRKQKNHEMLIDIFNEYSKTHPDAVLIMVGEGELKEHIKDKVVSLGLEKQCVFAGQRNDIYKLLSAADKFLFPSFYEGFPNAMLEAETSGLLCVASNVITKQVMIDGISYEVSLNSSVKEWAEVLSKNSILDRQESIDKVKEKKFDIKDEIERLESLYKSILAPK